MPKRVNNLFDKICTIENINLADDIARHGKSHGREVVRHDLHRAEENQAILEALRNHTYKTSKYTTRIIYEPKERLIFRLPYYPDRIVHHAIMNVLEPIFMETFVKNTYACMKGRGITAVAKDLKEVLKEDPEGTKYCFKCDIKKFYPSIDHDILKQLLRRKIKDKNLLMTLDEIIDSADGVPIGNYLSQYFANFYLAYFDHWVKEELGVKYYFRYADDMVFLCDSKEQLRSWALAVKVYLRNVLKLELKGNYRIFPAELGIDFVGYVFHHFYTLIRKSIKKNIFKVIDKLKHFPHEILQIHLSSYFGWLKYCNSKHLLEKIYQRTFIQYTAWRGKRTTFKRIKGKTIYLCAIQAHKKYFLIQFIYQGKPYEILSKNMNLFKRLCDKPMPRLCAFGYRNKKRGVGNKRWNKNFNIAIS